MKTILIRFLNNVLSGATAKDSPELLKILCSLVDASDKEKAELNNLLNQLTAKNQSKGGLLKMFK